MDSSTQHTAIPPVEHDEDPQIGQVVDVGRLRRRMWLTPPGDTLLLPGSPLVTAARVNRWVDASDTSDLGFVLPFVGVPLPRPNYDPDTRAGGTGRVWPHVPPQVLWHPWFWLPDRLYGRLEVEADDGTVSVEDDAVWALRLIEETWAAGLYDIDTGSWIDVLARVGLDVDDEATQQRIRRWQSGDPDEVLDHIDLSDDVDHPTDPAWAYDAARADIDSLWRCCFALTADQLLADGDDLADDDTSHDRDWFDDRIDLLVAARLSVGWMNTDEAGWWSDRIEGALQLANAADQQAFTGAVVTPMVERLTAVREQFWPDLEAAWSAYPDPAEDTAIELSSDGSSPASTATDNPPT